MTRYTTAGPRQTGGAKEQHHGQPDDTSPRRAVEGLTSDAFTIAKSAWLKDINADRQLTPLCFGVAYFISDVSSVRTEGHAWASINAIAKGTGASKRAVQGALTQLAGKHYLRVQSRRAQRKPSLLWMQFVQDPAAPLWKRTSAKTADVISSVSADESEDGGASDNGRHRQFSTGTSAKFADESSY